MPSAPPSPEHIAQALAVRAAARSAMRKRAIAAREALDDTAHARASARIEAALDALFTVPAGLTFGFCWPMRREFDARAFITRLLDQGARACLPVVTADAAPLRFRGWTPASRLAPDRFGIPTPLEGGFIVPDVLLIPLVAYDDRNFRIGYGGGFFDRTLAELQPQVQAIGVGFELARVADTLPGPFDLALDAVVTEVGVQRPG